MAEPSVLEWMDLGYIVETKSECVGLCFSVWAAKKNDQTDEMQFVGPNSALMHGRNGSSLFFTGIIGRKGCIDLMFEDGTRHFCDRNHIANVGLVMERLCTLANEAENPNPACSLCSDTQKPAPRMSRWQSLGLSRPPEQQQAPKKQQEG